MCCIINFDSACDDDTQFLFLFGLDSNFNILFLRINILITFNLSFLK